MADEGYILLARRFFEHPLWTEPRRFSRAEAWIDMIAEACFKKRVRLVGNERVPLERGQLVASFRYLAERWSWDKKTVVAFIVAAEGAGELRREKETAKGTIYTVVNYDTYQNMRTTKTDQLGYSSGTKQKEGKEGKERKPSPYGPSIRKAGDYWIDHYGGTAPFARIGKALNPLFKKYGEPEVLAVWEKYLERKDAEYATPEDFASKYGPWKDAKLKGQKQQPQQFDYSNATTEFKGFTA